MKLTEVLLAKAVDKYLYSVGAKQVDIFCDLTAATLKLCTLDSLWGILAIVYVNGSSAALRIGAPGTNNTLSPSIAYNECVQVHWRFRGNVDQLRVRVAGNVGTLPVVRLLLCDEEWEVENNVRVENIAMESVLADEREYLRLLQGAIGVGGGNMFTFLNEIHVLLEDVHDAVNHTLKTTVIT